MAKLMFLTNPMAICQKFGIVTYIGVEILTILANGIILKVYS
jgi:hypothetical protein